MQTLSTVPTVDWVLLESGESNEGQEFGSLYVQLNHEIVIPQVGMPKAKGHRTNTQRLKYRIQTFSNSGRRGDGWDGHAHSAPPKSVSPLTPGAVARLKGQLEARINEELRSRSVEPARSSSPSPMVSYSALATEYFTLFFNLGFTKYDFRVHGLELREGAFVVIIFHGQCNGL